MAKRTLEVSIIGDAASLKRAMGSAGSDTENFGKRVDGVQSRVRGHFAGIATSAVKMGAGAVAAYASIAGAEKAVSATETLAHTTLTLSKNYGLTVKTASEWAAVATSRGIDGAKLTMGFKGLSTAIRGAETGSKAQTAAFKELGISQDELAKHGNDLNFMLNAVSDGLAKMPAGTERSALQAKLFGRTWQTLSPLLRDGSGALQEQLASADKLGATFSGKSAKGLEDMIAKQREAKLATLGLQVAFGTQLAPALTKIIEIGTEVNVWLRDHTVVGKIAAGVVGTLAVAVGVYAVASRVIPVITGAWTAAQWLLNAALTANPIGIVVVALVALGAGLVIAYKHSETFRNIVNGAFGAVRDEVLLWKGVVTGALTAVETAMSATWTAIRTSTRVAWNAIEADILTPLRSARDTVSGVVDGIGTNLGAGWTTIRTAASTAWNAVESHVLSPLRDARDTVGGIVTALGTNLQHGWDSISTGVTTFATDLKKAVVGVFSDAAGSVIDFANAIIGVMDKIPGVSIDKIDKGKALKDIGALRAGGIVNTPTVIMGEEAPRHPEYVIPTNPAYRDRARMLLGQAANAIGFAQGGVLSFPQIESVWNAAGGNPSKANTMAWIAEAESSGDPTVDYGGGHNNPAGGKTIAAGLWQILGLPFPGNVYDPLTNAKMAIAKSSNGQNLGPWVSSRATWGPHIGQQGPSGGGGGGVLGAIGGAISKVTGIVGDLLSKGAGFLFDQLPGVGDLPDWLQGAGGIVLSKAKDYISDKVKSVLAGIGGGGGSGATGAAGGPSGVGSFDGIPMANWVAGALTFARGKGVRFRPTSGYRTGFDPHTVTGVSEHSGTRYPHGAVDFGGMVDPPSRPVKDAVVAATRDYKYPLLAPIGFRDDGHASGTGHASGGVIGRVGELGAEDLYTNPAGQVLVRPASRSGGGRGGEMMLTKFGDVHLGSPRAAERAMNKLAFRLAH